MPKELKYLRLSASQIDTSQTCLRKWWLGKVAKCPQPFDRKLLVGEVGHGVCENHLQSKPLYPEKWTSPLNRFTGNHSPHHITTTEQALIKALISKSIEEGVLVRHPDTQIELEFKPKGVAIVEEIPINLLGFVDHYYGNVIEDHKFIGVNSPRYYNASKLKKAIAMNLYAYAMYEEGLIQEDTCWLRYNLFVKDIAKPRIIKVEVERTKEEIYAYYRDEIEPAFRPMVLAAKNCTEYHQVESAMCLGKAKQACEKYGGCEFLDICLGKVTIEQYKERFADVSIEDKKKSQASVLDGLINPVPAGTIKEKKKMSGFLSGLAKSKEGGEVAPVEVKKEEVVVAVEPNTGEVMTSTPDKPATATAKSAPARAPWALDGCPVCTKTNATTLGVKKDGTPCKVCTMSTDELRIDDPTQPVYTDFDVVVSDKGVVSWTEKNKPEEVVAEAVVVEEAPVVKEVVESKGGVEFDEEPEPVVDAASIPAQPVDDEPSTVVPLDKSKDEFEQVRTGTKGWTLSYVPVRAKGRRSGKLGDANCTAHISELFDFITTKLLEVANTNGAGASDWYALDTWQRKDMIRQNAREVADMIGNSTVEANGMTDGSDVFILATSIERYASVVYGSAK